LARDPEKTIDAVMALVDDVLKKHPKVPAWGVVVGLPGPVDFTTGQPVAPPIMPGWNGFDVRTPFEERFNAPVWVDNDSNLLALGERARRRDSLADLIYCKIGSGIGAGLLSKGRIHRGANGAAGDIGHVRVSDSDVQCRCGKTGCLEAVAGGWALVRDAEAAIKDGANTSLAPVGQEGWAIAGGDHPRSPGRGLPGHLARPKVGPRSRRNHFSPREHVQPRSDCHRRGHGVGR
jgi:predicted NBD/HSP70 family sugar kinase